MLKQVYFVQFAHARHSSSKLSSALAQSQISGSVRGEGQEKARCQMLKQVQHDIWRHLLFILSFLVKPIQYFCLWERSEHRMRPRKGILVTPTYSMCPEIYLHFHFLCEMQLEIWQSLVAKIFFSNWKIFVSQLENYFFPVGHFFSVF